MNKEIIYIDSKLIEMSKIADELQEENQKLKKQQEKFIKYLEDEISKQDEHIEELKKWQEIEENAPSNDFDLYIANVVKRDLEYALSKYKEIIGSENK